MSRGARQEPLQEIRDFGTRAIVQINGNGTRGVSQPIELRNTEFPTDLGDHVRVHYDPNENVVKLLPIDD